MPGFGTGFGYAAQSSRIRGLLIKLLTGAAFGGASWTGSDTINRFSGPWLFAPLEPGKTAGIAQISNTFQSPVFDTRKDFWIKGLTHFVSTTPLSGAFVVQGGRKGAIEAVTVGGDGSDGTPATGTLALRTQIQKQARAIHVEAFSADHLGNATDQDGLFMGGAAGAKLTASISGLYMTVTALGGLTYNSKTAALAGDVLIGGTIQTGAQIPGTRVVDWGKCNAIGSISGTTMTTTAEVGAPIYGDASDGMTVMIDGGVVVGKVTGGSSPNWTISNSAGVSVPGGSRIFIESRGGRGSYLLSQSQTVASTNIDYFPPSPGWYGVPPDVPADRTGIVAGGYGPIVTRQTIAVINTKGTNLCKWVYGGTPASGLNSGAMSSLVMTGATTAKLVLTGPITAAGAVKGAWAKNTVYAVGDQVTSGGRTYLARVAHTSANAANTTLDTERQAGRWVAPNTAIAGWYPMGAWATATAYLAGDVVTQGGKLYFCCNSHTAAASFATDLAANRWSAMAGWTFKITASGYDPVNPTAPGGTTQVLPIGHFNRDWTLSNAGITVGDGTSATEINLVCDTAYTGNLPASNGVANLASTYTYSRVVTSPQVIFMGAPLNGAKPLDGKEPGEHADSLGQMDADKFAGFLGTDRIRSTSSYQAGGITSATGINDTTEETSRTWWQWVLGLTPGEDPLCNIVWSGMQQVVVQKPKRYFRTWVDIGARTWANWALGPFPNATLRPTATEAATGFVVATSTDPSVPRAYYAMGGQIYSGGHYQGAPPVDPAPSTAIGFNATTSLASSGRDPASTELLSLTFQHDTGDTLTTASGGTRIGWFDLTCSANFPGKLADGSRCIVDPVPNVNFVGLGSSVAGPEAVRGRQAVPIGNNPVYIDCTVRGTSITKRFGPYNVPGAPAAATTTLAATAQPVVSAATGASPYSFTGVTTQTIGTAATDRDVILAIVLKASQARTISGVTIGGVAASAIGNTSIASGTSTYTAIQYWRARVPTGTTADVVVTTSGSCQAVQIFCWTCTGLGVVYDANTAVGAAANVGASLTLATPPGGAVLAAHAYNTATSGATLRASSMLLTGTGNNAAQTVAGTASGGDLAWNVGTENGDVQLVVSTGTSVLSVISVGPAVALDANFIAGTMATATITRASTGTAVNAAGVITTSSNNVGRFDYSLGILRGLYVEPSRTNVCTWSTDLTNAAWRNFNTVTVVAASNILGLASFDVSNTVNLASRLNTPATALSNSTTYTRTCYAKAVSGNGMLIFERVDNGTVTRAEFNLLTGVVAFSNSGTPSMVDMGNGVYRCVWTFITGATGAQASAVHYIGAYGATATATTVRIAGVQVEQASDASSYIPTTSAAVTRSADTLNLTGLSQANGTYTARCWHVSGDYTDVPGVTITGGAATLTGISTKPIQGVTMM